VSRDEVSGHEFAFGEMLIGNKGGPIRLLAEIAREPGVGYQRSTAKHHTID
jgi:hypothetical protein